MVFSNSFTATTECSPSRASLLTSSYPTEHGVKTTPGYLDFRIDAIANQHPRPNLLRILSTAPPTTTNDEFQQLGYDVAWKGKWHLSPPSSKRSTTKQSSVLKLYGATSPWNPPDAGHSLFHASTLGGGRKYNHDGRYLRGTKHRFDSIPPTTNGKDTNDSVAESINLVDPYISSDDDSDRSEAAEEEEEECIFDFLKKHTLSGTKQGDTQSTSNYHASSQTEPFFLIASLVNPHDVWASGCFANLTDDEFYKETGYHPREFETLPIELPPNHKDDLLTKPLIQMILNEDRTFGDLPNVVDKNDPERMSSDALRYIRFYAYLHTLVDKEIGSLLDALDATGQMDNTIIIRMADHGEQALSHGLREKRMQCYEETMRIPLVINYPTGWFDATDDSIKESTQIGSTTRVVRNLVSSIDILPTIAELAGVDCSSCQYRGKSLVPFLRNGNATSNPDDIDSDEILFTFDEPLAPPGVPGFIRCLRTTDYKYAVYFTIDGKIMEYEMYHLKTDPYEMINLCGPNIDPDYRWHHYHDRLTQLMKRMRAVPTEFDWEELSTPRRYGWA